jgi:hypothetical protein
MGVEQDRIDEIKRKTRPEGEVNTLCKMRCINRLYFNPITLKWEDCPLCAKKLINAKFDKESEFMQSYFIPQDYKNAPLKAKGLFENNEEVKSYFSKHSLDSLENALSKLNDLIYVGKGPDTNYFICSLFAGVTDFIYPYLLKALRMNLKVCPYISSSDLSTIVTGLKVDNYRSVIRSKFTGGFHGDDVVTNEVPFLSFVEKQGFDLAKSRGIDLARLKTSDILIIDLTLSVSNQDLIDLMELIKDRDRFGKKTIVFSPYSTAHKSISHALKTVFMNLKQNRIDINLIELRKDIREEGGTTLIKDSSFKINDNLKIDESLLL